jgi:hypothetical protein
MRKEIAELQTYHAQSERILSSLASGDQSEFIISKLQQKEPLDRIIDELSVRSPTIASLKSGTSSQQLESRTSDRADGDGQRGTGYVSPGLDENEMYCFENGSRWTELQLSDTVIEHLLLLYFCWEYPNFSSISKRHFVRDFNTGKSNYCSPLLVNSILAVGCRFSDQVEARMALDDIDTAGMQCYLEAERLLSMCRSERSVTTIQSMGLMSTWNASRGDYRKARFYAAQALRMAVEEGLHQDLDSHEIPDDVREVRNTTFWGAFTLDQ